MERARARPPLPLLTTLRFFAAAEVVAYHAAQTRPGWERPVGFLSGLVSGGPAAVILFFVLSGFILTYVHAGEKERAACNVRATTFWRLRFARVAPAYYLGLLLAVPIVTRAVAQWPAPDWSIAAGFVSVMLFVQTWWPAYTTFWNFPAWSLSVECLFYALFPWLVCGLSRWPAATVLAVSYALVALSGEWRPDLLSWTRTAGQTPADWLVPGFFPLLHLPLFTVGMALARLYMFGPELSPRGHAVMLGAGIGLLVIIFGGAWLLPAWTRSDAVLVPVFALIVFGGARAASVVPVLTLPAFLLLGEASYSIYILHFPLRHIWEALAEMLLGASLTPWLNFPLYFGFVVLVSVVAFRQVETPLRHWIAGRRGGEAAIGRTAAAPVPSA